MAMQLKDMDRESLSQSIDSEKEESDHKEVYNTFKYRGRTLTRWKRLVKMNSTVLLIFSLVCFLYLLVFSSTKHWHNYFVCTMCLASALFGLSTGFSFNNPTSVKIYTNSVITGIASFIVCFYTLIILATMVLVSIDDTYVEQFNNFDINEIIIAYILGFIVMIFSLSTFVSHVRLYAVSEERKNLAYLLHNFKCYTFIKENEKQTK